MPPAFALSQDQTLRFISLPTPEDVAGHAREPTSTNPFIPSPPGQPAKPPGTDPARQHPPDRPKPTRQRRPRIPLPIPITGTDHRKNAPQNPAPSHSQRIAKQQRSLNALPKPDAVFNEQLPCGRPEACRPGPTGIRPCRVGSSAFQRGQELSGANHSGQDPFFYPAVEPSGPALGGGLLCLGSRPVKPFSGSCVV